MTPLQVLRWPDWDMPIRARGSTQEGTCLAHELGLEAMKLERGRGWTLLLASILEQGLSRAPERLRSQVCPLV